MNNSKSYKVLKDHAGFKKGSLRVCHPNLAIILAKSGLVSPDPFDLKKDVRKEELPKEEVKKEVEAKAKPVDDLPPEVLAAVEKTEKEEKVKPAKAGKAK